jgi:hypothetical protein
MGGRLGLVANRPYLYTLSALYPFNLEAGYAYNGSCVIFAKSV